MLQTLQGYPWAGWLGGQVPRNSCWASESTAGQQLAQGCWAPGSEKPKNAEPAKASQARRKAPIQDGEAPHHLVQATESNRPPLQAPTVQS